MSGIDGRRHPREHDWTTPTGDGKKDGGGKKRSGCGLGLLGLLAAPWLASVLLTGSVAMS